MLNKASVIILVVSLVLGLSGPSNVSAAATVTLGAADNFSVLAGSGITDTTPSNIISGDVGLSPTTGAAIGITDAEVAGTIYAVDGAGPSGSVNNPALLTAAKTALTAAYTDASNRTAVPDIATDLAGATLTDGVYHAASGTFSITGGGTLTLNGQGNTNAVFIFKMATTLITSSSSKVVLINGAQACNVFWQVGTSATLGTSTTFVGSILADQSITDNGGSTVEGRLLASVAAVTLNNTAVTKPTCVSPPSPPAPSGGGSIAVPLISVTKIPNPLALPSGPGPVTYDYTVLNIGTLEMNTVTVTDNKCANVVYISGDSDSDLTLDTNEVWRYRCTTTLSQTTTNTVTASGIFNGIIAVDTANATVVVGAAIIPPLIHLVKIPNIFLLPSGGGAVTYNYTVTNPGTAPLNNVSVIDNKCTGLPGRVVGHPGDLNHNNLLESNEAWSFTCLTNLTATTTNTGTAEGSANGLTAIDFAIASVVVAPVAVVPTTPASVPLLPNTGIAPDGNHSVPWDITVLAGILVVSLLYNAAGRKQVIS